MLKRSFLLILCLLSIGFYTCQNKKEECIVCNPMPANKTEVIFSLASEKLKKEVNYWFVNSETLPSTTYPPYYVILFGNEQILKKAIHTFKSEIGIQKKDVVYGITLYCDKGIKKGTDIKSEDVKAISLYLLEGKKIYHHFFLKKGSQFEHQAKYSALTVGMVLTTQDKLLNEVVLQGNVEKCYVSLTGNIHKDSFKDKSNNITTLSHKSGNDYLSPNFGGSKCGGLCSEESEYGCLIGPSGFPACIGGRPPVFCPVIISHRVLTEHEKTEEANLINTSLMYDFRDNFLAHYEIGV